MNAFSDAPEVLVIIFLAGVGVIGWLLYRWIRRSFRNS